VTPASCWGVWGKKESERAGARRERSSHAPCDCLRFYPPPKVVSFAGQPAGANVSLDLERASKDTLDELKMAVALRAQVPIASILSIKCDDVPLMDRFDVASLCSWDALTVTLAAGVRAPVIFVSAPAPVIVAAPVVVAAATAAAKPKVAKRKKKEKQEEQEEGEQEDEEEEKPAKVAKRKKRSAEAKKGDASEKQDKPKVAKKAKAASATE
jgi:hypothetical protein